MTYPMHPFAFFKARVTIALTLGLAACGGGQVQAPTTPTAPPPPPSLVIDQALPQVASRDTVSGRSIGGPVLQLAHRRGISSLRYSSDGALLLVTSGDGSVSVLDAEAGAVRASRRLYTRNYRERPATFDATGSRVLIAGAGRPTWRAFFIWDLLSDSVVAGPEGGGRQLIFAPNAEHVVGQLTDPRILAWTLRGVQAGDGLAADDHGFLLSPTQSRIVTLDELGRAAVLSANGEAVGAITRGADGDRAIELSDVQFRPNGGQLAVAWEDGRLELRHPETLEVLRELDVEGPSVVRYAENGERLYVMREVEEGLHATVLDPTNGETVGTVTSATESMQVELPHADGSILVGASGQSWTLIRPDGTGQPDALAGIENASDAHAVAFSPDGTRIAYADGQDVRVARFPEGGNVWTKHFTVSPSSVWEARWIGDDGLLTASRADVVYWNASGATRLNVRCGGSGSACMPSGALPDGRQVPASGARFSVQHDDGDIQILDGDYEPLLRIPGRRLRGNDCGDPCQPHVDPSGDGRYFALTLGTGVHLVDARTGRQRSRVRETGLQPEATWVSGTAEYYAVHWAGEGDDAASKLVVYSHRGREVVTVPFAAGAHVSPAGGAFYSDAEFALAVGRAIVRVTPSTQGHESRELGVDINRLRYLGATGRLAVTSSGQTTILEPVGQDAAERFTYASGIGVAFSGDGRVLAHCDQGTLRRIDLTASGAEASTELGACHARDISVSETGRFVAAPMAGVTRVYRADGTITRLTYVTDTSQHTVMLAVNERWGRFGMYGDEEAFASVMYRGPGPIATAPLSTAAGASARDQSLLSQLFAPPTPASAEAAPTAAE